MQKSVIYTNLQFLINLSNYIDSRITINGLHSVQVAYWGNLAAKRLNFSKSEIHSLYWASLLHDVGKISVPDNILTKKSQLSENEWLIIKLHPIVSANILTMFSSLSKSVTLVLTHQEKFDGSGYPNGLTGQNIPLGARILAVTDAFDAMTNDRVYRKAFNKDKAIQELIENKGKHFDPNIVDCFVQIINENNLQPNFQNKKHPSSIQGRRTYPRYHPHCSRENL